MEHFASASAGLRMVAGGNRVVCADLLHEALCGAQRRSRGRIFCRDTQPCPWIYHALHVSLHLCGGPLPVSSLYRPDSPRFGRRGQFGRRA